MPHTPLPWFAFEGECTGDPCIGCETGTIAVCEGNEGEAEANAEFIVQAANSHDDLLEACKLLRMWLRKIELADVFPDKMGGTEFSLMQECLRGADAAIAKAEGPGD